MALDDFRKKEYPDYAERPNTRLICTGDPGTEHSYSFTFITTDELETRIGITKCAYYLPSTILASSWDEAPIDLGSNGHGAEHVTYSFVRDSTDNTLRLYQIVLLASRFATPDASTGLIQKFGSPTTSIKDTIQNRMGANFDHQILTWANPESMIVLDSPSGDVDTMGLVYTEARLSNLVESQKRRIQGPDSSKM